MTSTSPITAYRVGTGVIVSIRLPNEETVTIAISETDAASLSRELAQSVPAYAGLTSAQLLDAPPSTIAIDPMSSISGRPEGGAALKIVLPGQPVLIEYTATSLRILSDCILDILTVPLS